MKNINTEQVQEVLNFPDLIKALDKGFAGAYQMPQRQVFELDNSLDNHDAFAVLPAWNNEVIGVKAFTYFPNPQPGYRSLYSKITLFDRKHGEPLAFVDGTNLTYWRTAAVSALASRYLSRDNAHTLLFCGTGNLSTYMIAAHLSVRCFERVLCWGRNTNKVSELVKNMETQFPSVKFEVVSNLKSAAQIADVISCATGSPEPLIYGDWVKPGTHIDLIGNHHKLGRECDTALVLKAGKVVVDSKENVLNEAGELLIPISEGKFEAELVYAELSELCNGSKPGRKQEQEVTLFKSVGTALSDLVAAHQVYQHVI